MAKKYFDYYTDRMSNLREKMEKIPEKDLEKIVEKFVMFNEKVDMKTKLDALFSEISEDSEDKDRLIYIGEVEEEIEKFVE